MIDPFAPIEVVRAFGENMDPAIDARASNLDEYRKSRNPQALKFHAGMSPTKFKLQALEAMYVADKLDSMNDYTKLTLAFMASCHEITCSDGSVIKPPVLNKEPIHGVEIATRVWVNTVAAKFRIASIYEMGLVAIKRASLTPEEFGPFDW